MNITQPNKYGRRVAIGAVALLGTTALLGTILTPRIGVAQYGVGTHTSTEAAVGAAGTYDRPGTRTGATGNVTTQSTVRNEARGENIPGIETGTGLDVETGIGLDTGTTGGVGGSTYLGTEAGAGVGVDTGVGPNGGPSLLPGQVRGIGVGTEGDIRTNQNLNIGPQSAAPSLNGQQIAQAQANVQATARVTDRATMDAPTARRMIETYFNGISTWQADFVQTQSDQPNVSSRGTFYLNRPGQFLWQYEAPLRQKVVGTGTAVYYVDQSSSMGNSQTTQLPMDAGLGRLIRGRSLDLQEAGLQVRDITTRTTQAGALVTDVTLVPLPGAQDQAIQTLVLTFDGTASAEPDLVGFRAKDMAGVTTAVRFDNVQQGMALESELFAFTPALQRERPR